VKSNKNDRNDAEAICEAVGRPTMRFVPPKSPEQLAIQALHRIRQRLVQSRTRLVNQIRGILAEHGIVIARDIWRLRRALAEITGQATDDLNKVVRVLILEAQAELMELDCRIASCDRRIRELYRTSELCQRLGEIEGIGPVTATALVAAVGDRSCFKNGRQFAAWLGLVPKQRSSGGRNRLFGISKRGDRYLRTLMIHGARAALGKAGGKQDPRSRWLAGLRQRRHPNVAAVALANKNARIVWAMLAGNVSYEPARSVQAA
jgi:transposase